MMDNIFFTTNQLRLLVVALLSMNEEQHDFLLENGYFEDGEIEDYAKTIQSFLNGIEEGNGAILVSEINFDDIKSCHNLRGKFIN